MKSQTAIKERELCEDHNCYHRYITETMAILIKKNDKGRFLRKIVRKLNFEDKVFYSLSREEKRNMSFGTMARRHLFYDGEHPYCEDVFVSWA